MRICYRLIEEIIKFKYAKYYREKQFLNYKENAL